MKKIILLISLSLGIIVAQKPVDSLKFKQKYWSIETSVVWPIYPGIYKVHFVRELWRKKVFAGELGFGLCLQPERNIPAIGEGNFSEEFILLFYRQYFWKGLHIEIDNNFAYGRLRDWQGSGTDYATYAIFHDMVAGYRFELLKKHKVSLTITPQAGGGFTSYVNDSWPRAELPFWELQLLVGMKF